MGPDWPDVSFSMWENVASTQCRKPLDKKTEEWSQVDKTWATKLSFMTSDISRFAAVNMRIAEFFEAMPPAFKNKATETRVTFNHFKVVAAFWLWLR